MLESITDAFYALDREFRFTYLNQRTLEHFGATREMLLGNVLWDVFPMMRGTVFQHEYERAQRAQCSVIFETVSPLTNGWVEVRAYPTPQGLAAYFRDITDRKQAEERKSEFLAILAHEVRNPLAPLRNGLEILKTRSSADPTVSQTVAMMDRQMTHLARLVDDLLDLSRITRGKLELRRQKVLLTETLATAVESARAAIEANRHQLSVDLRVKNLLVDGDPARLVQVFSNLLLNSAKYTDAGGFITLTLEREDSEAVVAVQDNGIGIPPVALEQIFDMFRRLPTQETRPTDGLGIGLSVVRTIVELHGGCVQAFSEGPGKGSRFTVRLLAAWLDLNGQLLTRGPSPPGADLSPKNLHNSVDKSRFRKKINDFSYCAFFDHRPHDARGRALRNGRRSHPATRRHARCRVPVLRVGRLI